jgi:Ca-activated chloride channel family protein
MVIEANSGKYKVPFPVVAIYPREGTFWSDHPVGIVNADWVSPEHREAARAYVKFLMNAEQQARALAFGFRPGLVEVPLAAPIDTDHGVDPKEPKTTLEVPKPEVVQAIRKVWEKSKKHSHVVLVMDISGSMNEGGRIENSRKGALQMVRIMKDEDSFALLAFNSRLNWAMTNQPLAVSRRLAERTIGGLWAEGGTALYDAILSAHKSLERDSTPDKISAIVVLTDGQDTNSRNTLEALTQGIKFDGERNNIRIFTIGYGQDANKEVLKRIADATQAKSYEGTNENIEEVFKDISTFF